MKRLSSFGRVKLGAAAFILTLAIAAPASGWVISSGRHYDGCNFDVRTGQNENVGSAFGRTEITSSGSSCVRSVKIKLGYRRNGSNYVTNYSYSTSGRSVSRSNATPRYARGCIWGTNTSRWGCYTLWA